MKKHLGVIVLMLLTFLLNLVSCASCEQGNSVPSNPDVVSQTGSPNTLTSTVSAQFFRQNYLGRLFSSQAISLHSFLPTLESVNQYATTECFRELGDGRAYAVYKTDMGGWMYLFFECDTLVGKNILSHTIYVEKVRSHKDFNSLKKGSSLKDVTDVDPAATIWMELWQGSNHEVYSLHLLTDGVLRIRYTEKDGDYVVTECEYASRFILNHSLPVYDEETKTSSDKDIPFNYQILSEDYPR